MAEKDRSCGVSAVAVLTRELNAREVLVTGDFLGLRRCGSCGEKLTAAVRYEGNCFLV